MERNRNTKSIIVKCPHCNDTSEIFLGSDAFMVVLSCPSCRTSLMYYYGKTLEIEPDEMEKVQERAGTTEDDMNESPDWVPDHAESKSLIPWKATHRAGKPVRKGELEPDDILNLKISLALNNDVNEFIENI